MKTLTVVTAAQGLGISFEATGNVRAVDQSAACVAKLNGKTGKNLTGLGQPRKKENEVLHACHGRGVVAYGGCEKFHLKHIYSFNP